MRARLTLESGQAFPLVCDLEPGQPNKLGRDRKNTIVLRDQHASRWHAEITPEGGHWVIRDCNSTNDTRLNGTRIGTTPMPIEPGAEVRIGDTCFRFTVSENDNGTKEMPLVPEARPEPDFMISEVSHTTLHPDELTALFRFMDGSMREASPQGLVTLALTAIHDQTSAAVCGFLSLDEDDPLPKTVLPESVQVDTHLSRQLTLRVQGEGKTVWLAASSQNDLQTDSLLSYRDAVCVPVQGGEAPLGAIHVYKQGKPFGEREVRFCEVLAGYLSKSLSVLRARRALEADISRLRVHTSGSDQDLIGESPPMKQLRQQIRRLAERPNVILVHGESGSGKELVSLALHRQSTRREGPLVAVNCASIAASMPEAELFGHCKGSFTGADRDRPGYFQQAEMGTLFLDEIGELSEDCQAKLLRVLENRTFRPVGSKVELKADVRIVAATNRDLKKEFQEGRFRKDLYFRLAVVEVRVPPLRDRREDIPALVNHFLSKLSVEYRRNVRLADAAMKRLQEYHWPGNVRQLRSVLEHAVAMSESPLIEEDEFYLFTEGGSGPIATHEGLSLNLKELEEWAIRQALKQTDSVMVQAAKLLGIHRETLMEKMKKYGIEKGG